MGRFLNADAYASTGTGLLGYNMFAYCNNNPVIYTDILGDLPLPTAFDFLDRWFNGDGSEQNFGDDSNIVKALKKSNKMRSLIDQAIENFKSGISNEPGSAEFTHEEDGWDLYLSTQHFNYEIDVVEETRTKGFWFWKHEEVRYTATVVVYDVYNFDNLRSGFSLGNILNNGAYILNVLGVGNDYEWYATYTFSTKWETVP